MLFGPTRRNWLLDRTDQSKVRSDVSALGEPLTEREEGNAIVEFVGVMTILIVPAVIALVAVSAVLMGQSALTAAARDGARGFVRADTSTDAYSRAEALAQEALDSRGIDSRAIVSVRCSANPCLTPGANVSVTVAADINVPFVDAVTMSEEFSLTVDEFREGRQ